VPGGRAHGDERLGPERQPLQPSQHEHRRQADDHHVRARLRRARVRHRRDLQSQDVEINTLAWSVRTGLRAGVQPLLQAVASSVEAGERC